MKIQGSHGSSGLNADDWRNLDCLRNSPAEIRITIASLVMKISIIELDRKFLVPSIACRHIPIGENTEVLPFGVDEVQRRITGRAINVCIKPHPAPLNSNSQL